MTMCTVVDVSCLAARARIAPRAGALRAADGVRWVGAYHPAYRLDPELIAARAWGDADPVVYNVLVADKRID